MTPLREAQQQMDALCHPAAPGGQVPSAAPRSSLRATRRSELPRRLLADVLWDAANVWLLDRASVDAEAPLEYSCNAVIAASRGSQFTRKDIREYHLGMAACAACDFLLDLGCYPGDPAFEDFGASRRQGVRYMWLLLAMHVAEDEGITL